MENHVWKVGGSPTMNSQLSPPPLRYLFIRPNFASLFHRFHSPPPLSHFQTLLPFFSMAKNPAVATSEKMTKKVDAEGESAKPNAVQFGDAAAGSGGDAETLSTTSRRKTPSELRGELLLKRKSVVEIADESPADTNCVRNADGAVCGAKESDAFNAPLFRRKDEHFPVTTTVGTPSKTEDPKESVPRSLGSMNSSLPMNLNAKHEVQNLRPDGSVTLEIGNPTEKRTNNIFKSVRELSLGGEKLYGFSSVDMGKALKGLVSCERHAASAPLAESIDKSGTIAPKSFCSEICVPGHKIPIDLTLKTNVRLVSSSSVNWFHRLMNSSTSSVCEDQSMSRASEPTSSQLTNYLALHSWVHPQFTLTPAAISALTSTSGGQKEFLNKRHETWQDSFRDLYYRLRKNMCRIFYVCTTQFVVMFTAFDGPNKTRSSCYAYVSQSTRNLRSLLKGQDASFSMPLCHSKVEEVTAEDLAELSEIEKHSLGQTRALESMVGIDNTPESLLMFTGNKNVHSLFDFLLNYRSFFAPLAGDDVPVLYSPVLFENASRSAPEVRCKQVRKADYMSSQLKDSSMVAEPKSISSAGICYGVEISGAYLPPWVIGGICNVVRSNEDDFQASFVTESSSTGLNVALDIAKDKPSEETGSFGIADTTLFLQGRSAFLKGLTYDKGSAKNPCSYTAFLSAIE